MARGSELVTLEELKNFRTPPATHSYQPISHYDLAKSIRTISSDLLRLNLIGEKYEVARDGNQLFSTLTFDTGTEEMGLSVGFRNSVDKSMSVGMCIGSSVLVCSNMMFTAHNGGIVVMKKHSRNLLEVLEATTLSTLYKAKLTFAQLVQDSALMKSKHIYSDEAFRLMGWLYGHGLLAPRQLPVVHDHWMASPHAQFRGDSVWNFYNACTQAFKTNPPHNTLERHIGLHSAIVNYCQPSEDYCQPIIEGDYEEIQA